MLTHRLGRDSKLAGDLLGCAPEGYMLEHPLLAPELTDAVGAVEVGWHQDVEEFGAGSGTEGVEALPESAL